MAGDAIAQKREDDPYDAKRAAAFAAFDGCYRAVQQLTYPPIIAEFQGQHIIAFLGSLGYTSLPVTSAVFGPLEQTLVSQLVIIPTIYYVRTIGDVFISQGLLDHQFRLTSLSTTACFFHYHWNHSRIELPGDSRQSKDYLCSIDEKEPSILDTSSICGICVHSGRERLFQKTAQCVDV